ncbi:MAG TPA: SNF2-related protein [Blastocatellia bacterium]
MYFRYRRAIVTSMKGGSATVKVTGSEKYEVRIDKVEARLMVSCTCPFFRDGSLCKHIWAAFLAADARGFLGNERSEILELSLGAFNPLDKSVRLDQQSTPEALALAKKRLEEAEIAAWKKQLMALAASQAAPAYTGQRGTTAIRKPEQIVYIVDVAKTMDSRGISLDLGRREMKGNGEWGKPKGYATREVRLTTLTDKADREILGMLSGARESYYGFYYREEVPSQYRLVSPLAEKMLPMICRTGRCFIRLPGSTNELRPLNWDNRGAWAFWVELTRDEPSDRFVMTGTLRRGTSRRPLAEPLMLSQGGLVFWPDRVALLDDDNAFSWIAQLRARPELYFPLKHGPQLLEQLLELPHLPRIDLPPELSFTRVSGAPSPLLKFLAPGSSLGRTSDLTARLFFNYETETVALEDKTRGVFRQDEARFIQRDVAAEQGFATRLWVAGFREEDRYYSTLDGERRFTLNPKKFGQAVRDLMADGWKIEAEGKLYRTAGNFRIDVTSGIDWFELRAELEFGDTFATLPQLLAAARRGENTISLGDGTFGLLPEDWLKKYGMFAAFGETEKDHVRFTRSQAGLLDALLASQQEATFDDAFAAARAELKRFHGVEAADPPDGFTGELREYQREGLGWLHFLRGFGFGGCLADCMGLGKTVMTLALLESRRQARKAQSNGAANCTGKEKRKRAVKRAVAAEHIPPSLLVVPKSLVFNWKQEAKRFTPSVKVLDHTGIDRIKGSADHFAQHDLIITTYGTLRRDAAEFTEHRFDYVILDESQAVKNADTESAKAVRLLKGNYKLALSGTPIENHLGELWSLFEFLNPGLLGSASVFKLFGGSRNPEEEARSILGKALRPFILRRTKEQVAKDLPAKLEQTIFCELEPQQRKLYDELRSHYRASLLGLIEQRGMKQSKIQILEALLRLRQAACHPGLIDKTRASEPSAKLDMLIMQLSELIEEGHKVLVFSQFTSFLSIVRNRLDGQSISYEYLDGKTRDRQSIVERFQSDPRCKLFLISLKAGGLGLNLTSAEYVFLLDPWWNPAVEAQAIDRAHRIGQTRQVFAYRLIARDTVEEKVLALQETKRNLADAIIGADNSLIRDMTPQDLDLLFS